MTSKEKDAVRLTIKMMIELLENILKSNKFNIFNVIVGKDKGIKSFQ